MSGWLRGGVYLAKLNPTKKGEVGKIRPVVILMSQFLLDRNPGVIFVCPLSSKSFSSEGDLHMRIEPRQKLKKESFVLIEHARSLSTSRLESECLATLTDGELSLIIKTIGYMIT